MLRRTFDDWISKLDRDQHIWRYINFTKFVSIVDRKELFFPQVKIMSDRYEGFVNSPENSDLHRDMRVMRSKMNSPWSLTVISCWCISDYESAPLWGWYASGAEGVAICTTVGKLKDSIDCSQLDHVSSGVVQYRDPPEPDIKPGEQCEDDVSMFFKGPAYADEKEFRIIGHVKDMYLAEGLHGAYVPTNLDLLFEQVYVSQDASQWFFGLVISLVKKVAPSAEILRSEIGNDPYRA